jgi:hypothetical protein
MINASDLHIRHLIMLLIHLTFNNQQINLLLFFILSDQHLWRSWMFLFVFFKQSIVYLYYICSWTKNLGTCHSFLRTSYIQKQPSCPQDIGFFPLTHYTKLSPLKVLYQVTSGDYHASQSYILSLTLISIVPINILDHTAQKLTPDNQRKKGSNVHRDWIAQRIMGTLTN